MSVSISEAHRENFGYDQKKKYNKNKKKSPAK